MSGIGLSFFAPLSRCILTHILHRKLTQVNFDFIIETYILSELLSMFSGVLAEAF